MQWDNAEPTWERLLNDKVVCQLWENIFKPLHVITRAGNLTENRKKFLKAFPIFKRLESSKDTSYLRCLDCIWTDEIGPHIFDGGLDLFLETPAPRLRENVQISVLWLPCMFRLYEKHLQNKNVKKTRFCWTFSASIVEKRKLWRYRWKKYSDV